VTTRGARRCASILRPRGDRSRRPPTGRRPPYAVTGCTRPSGSTDGIVESLGCAYRFAMGGQSRHPHPDGQARASRQAPRRGVPSKPRLLEVSQAYADDCILLFDHQGRTSVDQGRRGRFTRSLHGHPPWTRGHALVIRRSTRRTLRRFEPDERRGREQRRSVSHMRSAEALVECDGSTAPTRRTGAGQIGHVHLTCNVIPR